MSLRDGVVHLAVASVLITGAAGATSPAPAPAQQRDVDLVASAQPSDQRRVDRDAASSEVVVRSAEVKVDTVATTTTSCHGCRGESTVLQVVHVPGPGAARVDNVASAWSQGCWDCTATALAVQVVLVGPGTRARATNRSLAAGQACASCAAATAAFQVVVQVEEVGRLPDDVRAALLAWFAAQVEALRATAPAQLRQRAASRALLDLRRDLVRGLGARSLSARVQVTR